MITRNEKAKGLWWRLLATLPVLAVLLIANTKVAAQEKKAENKPITVEMGKFDLYSDEGSPLPLKDTVIYNEDGSYVKCTTTDAVDPISGETRKKLIIQTCNADGTPSKDMLLHWDIDDDVIKYGIEPKGDLKNVIMNIQALTEAVDTIYNVVEEMPQFPGGETAMMEFVAKNVVYPQEARDKEISGRVYVNFIVDKDGSICDVNVAQGIGGGCDEEAIRVVKAMPKWKPGIQKGKPVRVHFTMPFTFKLQ